MAIKPLVLVFQELRGPTATIVNPVLSGCVVGPHYYLQTYVDNHDAINAGAYDLTNGTVVASLPSAKAGMKVRSQGFHMWLDRARAIIDTGSGGSITQAGLFTGASSDNYSSSGLGVLPGDTVKLSHTVALTAVAGVVVGTNNKLINLTGLPGGFDPTVEFAVGDTLNISAIPYTGKITAVTSTTITLDTAFASNVVGGNISVIRVRLLRDGAGHTYSVKQIPVDVNNAPIVNQLQLTTNFPFTAASAVSYEITRVVNKAELTSGFTMNLVTGVLSVAPAGSVLVGNIVRNLTDYSTLLGLTALADAPLLYPEYTALDVSFAHIPAKIGTNLDPVLLLGVVDSRNPLGLGALTMFANAQATMYAIGIASEDDAGFLGAIDVINRNHFYAQAVLSQKASLITAFKNNNVAQAVPEKANYGVVVGNHILPSTVTPVSSTAGATSTDIVTSLKTLLTDLTVNFEDPANPVFPGDIVTIGGLGYTVDKVVNGNLLKVLATTPFPSNTAGLTYTITRALSKDQQAASIAATSRAIGDKRAVMTYSDAVVINNVQLPGYYLNCAVAGMCVGLPAQAGITNKGIAGIDKVLHTNWDYFSDDQLDVIAAGGTLIVVQDDANSLPYIRMQLTTDPSTLETGELSVVKNNDYLSLFFKGIVKPYLGTWNVTPELISALNIAVTGGINFQVNNKVSKIGAPLISANILLLAQSDISPDRVEIKLDTKQPKPLNTIGLHMIL